MSYKEFTRLEDLCNYLAELTQNTPLGWFREVGIHRKEEADRDIYVLVHLTDPLTGSTYTTWLPKENEIKLWLEPCRDRGSTCPASELLCTEEDEIECQSTWLFEKIREEFVPK